MVVFFPRGGRGGGPTGLEKEAGDDGWCLLGIVMNKEREKEEEEEKDRMEEQIEQQKKHPFQPSLQPTKPIPHPPLPSTHHP